MAAVIDKWTGQRPVVVLMSSAKGVPEVFKRDILLGLEEEGVPVTVKTGDGEVDELGVEAARLSTLEVGVGLDHQGCVVMHHRKLRNYQPLFRVNLAIRPDAARLIGMNAARLVKVLPFKPV